MSDIHETVVATMAQVFGMAAAEIPASAAPGIVANWDSLRHMQLIVALEETFSVQFADHELNTLISIPKIIETVTQKVKA